MKISEYLEAVKRTTKSCQTQECDGQGLDLLHWTLGLSGEVGEIVDTVKKYSFYNKELDIANLQEELGDLMFYIFAMCETLGLPPEYVMANNKAKLDLRYKDGYSDKAASERADKQEKGAQLLLEFMEASKKVGE